MEALDSTQYTPELGSNLTREDSGVICLGQGY